MRRLFFLCACAAALEIKVAFGWVTQVSHTSVPSSTPATRCRTRRRNQTKARTMALHVTHHQQEDITAPPTGAFTTISTSPTVAVDVDNVYYSQLPLEGTITASSASSAPRITLTRYLDQAVKKDASLEDVQSLLLGLQMACKTISNLVNRAGLVYNNFSSSSSSKSGIDPQQQKNADTEEEQDGRMIQSMKRLDQLSTLVLQNALQYTGKFEIVSPAVEAPGHESPAEHQPGVVLAKSLDTNVTAVCDPLDGSGNADASVCTGTVFGIFDTTKSLMKHAAAATNSSNNKPDETVQSVLQPARNMRAAGYCLYSSATLLVFTLGENMPVQGFTLDPQLNEFVLTHPDLQCPPRGSIYSCNEGNSESGWSDGWRNYLRAIKTGTGQSQRRYAHRYVGSMVGDVHRTILYGGIFAYPANDWQPDGNLQLLYKTAPLAYIVHRAGGRAIDGRGHSLLDVRPERVHQKSPCFLGSLNDVQELETYLSQ